MCLHGEAFRGRAGLNTTDGSSRDGGSNLGPPSGSSCFTKIADRSWWKFHSNSEGKQSNTLGIQFCRNESREWGGGGLRSTSVGNVAAVK